MMYVLIMIVTRKTVERFQTFGVISLKQAEIVL